MIPIPFRKLLARSCRINYKTEQRKVNPRFLASFKSLLKRPDCTILYSCSFVQILQEFREAPVGFFIGIFLSLFSFIYCCHRFLIRNIKPYIKRKSLGINRLTQKTLIVVVISIPRAEKISCASCLISLFMRIVILISVLTAMLTFLFHNLFYYSCFLCLM